ncbi:MULTISPECIES: DotD/TraH family lipoprotein [Cupriavidus]
MLELAKKSALCAATLALVAACAQPISPGATDEQKVVDVLGKLDGYASAAVNAQRELAMAADAKNQNALVRRQRLLTDVVSYDFYGDVETVLKDITNKYDYKLEVYGKRPPGGVVTSVYVKNKSVLDVLKNIGYATPFFDIKLNPDAIELHYKG